MNIDKILNAIKEWSINIEQMIELSEINGKDHIKEYKLKDIQQLDKIIKKCVRCGKYFIPNPNFKQHQIYCDKNCRNISIQQGVYTSKLDDKMRQIDLLRKTIYERKYRVNRDNLDVSLKEYNIILQELKRLSPQRNNISTNVFEEEMQKLREDYHTLVKRDKKKGSHK